MSTIVWPCRVCGDPIADGTGYLHVPADELHAADERRRRIEEAKQGDPFWTVEELREREATAPWLAHHRDCDPNPGAGDYWIPVERVRTARDVLARTAHLLGKEWLPATDWPRILRHAARA